MRNFLKSVISRHTQPEGNIIPRMRGRYEPESIQPSRITGEAVHTPRTDAPVRRPDDPLASRSIPEPSDHNERAVPNRDETNEDNISRDSTSPKNFFDPGKSTNTPQFTDPINFTRTEQLKDPGFFERSVPFRDSRQSTDPEDIRRDPGSGDPERSEEPWRSGEPEDLRNRPRKAGDDMTLQPPGIPVRGTREINQDAEGYSNDKNSTGWRPVEGYLGEARSEKATDFPHNLPGDGMDAYRAKSSDQFLLPENRDRMGMVLPATGDHEAGRNAEDGRVAFRSSAEGRGVLAGSSSRMKMQIPGNIPSPGQQIRSEPVIRVSIGRIEVKAVHPVQPPPPTRKETPKPKLSLDDFLNQRKRS